MRIYKEKILPFMIACTCSSKRLMDLRSRVVPLAYGEVLEVGIGSALNLALYDRGTVNRVIGLEPSEGMLRIARRNHSRKTPIPVEWLEHSAENIPLDDSSVDSIVLTYTLCSIPDWRRALQEMHRVLKPNGRLLYCEHGRSPDPSVEKWQNRLNGMWGVVSGGCNLNRPVLSSILSAGFSSEWNESMYDGNGPRIFSYMSIGTATKVNSL